MIISMSFLFFLTKIGKGLSEHNPPQHPKHKQMQRIKQIKKPFMYPGFAAALPVIEKIQHQRNKNHAELKPHMFEAGRYCDKDIRQKECKRERCPFCLGSIPIHVNEQASQHIHKGPVTNE